MPIFTSQALGTVKGLGFSASTSSVPATQYFIAYIKNASYGVPPTQTTNIYVDADKNFYPLSNTTGTTRAGLIPKISYAGSLTSVKDVIYSVSFNNQAASYDASGNKYFAGYLSDASIEGYIVKITSGDVFSWQRNQSNSSLVLNRNLTVDPSGNVYICGYVTATTNRGFIAKYNSSGTLQWQKQYTPPDNTSDFYSIVANDSYLFVSGQVTGSSKGYIASINTTTGAVIWQIVFYDNTTYYNVNPYKMVIDSSNNIYIAGGIIPTNGYLDPFVMKVNSSGTIQWYKRWNVTGSLNERFYNLQIDKNETYLYAVGQGAETGTGYGNCIIFKIATSNGAVSWSRRFNNASGTSTNGNGVGVSSDAFYVAAATSDGTNQVNLVGVFPTDGTKTGTYTLGTLSIVYNTYAAGTEITTYTTGTATITVADAGITSTAKTSTVATNSSTLTGPTSI